MTESLGDPAVELKREQAESHQGLPRPRPTREQRKEIYGLKRAGYSRKAIAKKLNIGVEDLVRTLGPEKDVETKPRRSSGVHWHYLSEDSAPRRPRG